MPRRPGHPVASDLISDEDFAAIWLECGCSPISVAEKTGTNVRTIYKRRQRMEEKGYDLPSICRTAGYSRQAWFYPRTVNARIEGGSVLVGGDAHIWPGNPTPMWRAFCAVAEELKPTAICLNGDVIDGARISRHTRLPGFTPSLADEIAAVRENLALIPSSEHRWWTMGNHDARVDAYLAAHAPEMEDYAGSLVERFQDWRFTWSVTVNEDTLIRHRFRSGIHAAYNNSLQSGLSTVTNHTHQLDCKPIVDMRGTRYGIETGMLGDPLGPQFQYGEGQPNRARSGFALLTFDSAGNMQPPELCEWRLGGAWFRGKVWAEKPRIRIPAKRSVV